MRHPIHQSAVSGSLTTPLPEDVFHLIHMQIRLLEEYLLAKGMINTETGTSVLLEAILSILRNLWYHHTKYRYTFLQDVESSIACANDLLRMLNKVEEMMRQLTKLFPLLDWEEHGQGDSLTSAIRHEVTDLTSMFSNDAVNACQRVVSYIMRNIQNSKIASDLFSREWEDVMVHNEVALSIVKTFEDYLVDLRNYIEHDFLYHKIVSALVRATVCFYTQSFVKKAQQMRRVMKRDFAMKRTRQVAFLNSARAITRMTYDIQIFRDYFHTLTRGFPTLTRLVSDELSIFVVLIECMWLAAGRTKVDSLDEYVVVVHKKISGANSVITRLFLSDLWLLMGPKDEHRNVEREVRMMDKELQLLSDRVKEEASCSRTTIDQSMCLRLDEVLRSLYEDRIIQENSSLCGALARNQRRKGPYGDEESNKSSPGWYSLEGFRQRLGASKEERELLLMFKNLK